MTWARIDDSFHGHPKVAGLRLDALGLWVKALSFSAAYLTDGAVSHTVLPQLSGLPMARARKLAEELVKGDLWERAGQDFLIHDYLRYNPSRRDVLEERERKQRAGVLGARARWGNPAEAMAPARADGMADRMAPRMALPAEVPCPRPDPTRPVPSREQRQPPPPPPASAEAGAGGGRCELDNSNAETWSVAPWPSPEALAHLWNTTAPDELFVVESLSRRRIQKAEALLRQFPDRSWWEAVFDQYRQSRFLRGRLKRAPGHERFTADFDWLISTNKSGIENAARVHDGAYLD